MVVVEQIGFVVVVLLMVIEGYFYYKKRQQRKAKEQMLAEVNKMFALVNARNMLVSEELRDLVTWTNQDLPLELTAIFITELRSRNLITSTEDKNIAKVITDISKLMQERVEGIFERVAKKTQENFKIEG